MSSNKQKSFNAYYDELSNWMTNNDYNGSLEYAFNNGFDLHAVSLWIGSGASELDLPIRINRKKELAEIKLLCKSADIFICKECNHHSFFTPGEVDSDTTLCESCLKTMHIHSRGV